MNRGPEDPARVLEKLEDRLASARRMARLWRVEIYHRLAWRVRARREPDGTAFADAGTDEGLAVRVVGAGSERGFAAVSGCGDGAVRRAAEQAVGTACRAPGSGVPWAQGGPGVLEDLDAGAGEVPTPACLHRWLRDAAGSAGPAWVEWARTLETIVADGGLRAVRSRSRAWAMVTDPAPGGGERRRLVAGRGLERLDADASRPREPFPTGEAVAVGGLPRGTPVLFDPPAAAALVRALVRALCGPGLTSRLPVGPAFRVTDDPGDPTGLAGGSFDDAGFPTRRRVIADGTGFRVGEETRAAQWRGSFRDPPAPSWSNLVVPDGHDPLPARCVGVSEVRIEPLGPDDWALGLRGSVREDGRDARPLEPAWLRVRPSELVRGCQGAVGRSIIAGSDPTRAPALLWDALHRGAKNGPDGRPSLTHLVV